MNPLVFTGDGPSSLTLGIIGIVCLAAYEAPQWFGAWLASRRRKRLSIVLAMRRSTRPRRAA
jgi:hypothetical protein